MSPELVAWNGATAYFLTPIPEAVAEIKRRQQDTELRSRVLRFLRNDIPEHFEHGPILYLSRHLATPNFETLRFIELTQSLGMPLVIGQDTHDIFVSHNPMKKALGKMPIVKCLTCDEREMVENFTIINFDTAQGRPLKDIETVFGQNLVSFHNELFKMVYPETVTMADDAGWIERHHRGDLIRHYKELLALLVVHGIMFETYELHEQSFVEDILKPSFDFVQEEFGVRPLICELVPLEIFSKHNWESYPSVLYKAVKDAMASKQTPR